MTNLIRAPLTYHLSDFEKELSRFLGRPEDTSNVETADWLPAIDIKEEEKQFLIRADIPGVDPKNLDVSMENGVLTIKGERESASETEEKGWVRKERKYGSFYRRFSLPDSADDEKITAKCNHGVLDVTIPKRAEKAARRINVHH